MNFFYIVAFAVLHGISANCTASSKVGPHSAQFTFCHENASLIGIENATCSDEIQELTFYFCAVKLQLDFVIEFCGKTSVALIGEETEIECTSNAGLSYNDVQNVTIRNVTLIRCGILDVRHNVSSGIWIIRSSSILIQNLRLEESNGTGIHIVNCCGDITIENSSLLKGQSKTSFGGGGLLINGNTTEAQNVTILNCNFEKNDGYYSNESSGMGGGLGINTEGKQVNIMIKNCTFKDNKSSFWGGGMNVVMQGNMENSTVIVDTCWYIRNTARKAGGGGADIGYFLTHTLSNNTIQFINTAFESNVANVGGGVMVYSDPLTLRPHIRFNNCTWKENQARYASAIYLLPRNPKKTFVNLPESILNNCSFYSNTVYTYNDDTMQNKFKSAYRSYLQRTAKGALYSMGYNIVFHGNIEFINNTGSAVYLVSSTLELLEKTRVTFEGNSGNYGGAISLYGSSTINLRSGAFVNFTNNEAFVYGGALYQHIPPLEYIARKNCFIFITSSPNHKAVEFYFRNNQVLENKLTASSCTYCGKSLFIYSINPCKMITRFENSSKNIRFIFENSSKVNEISTEGLLKVIESRKHVIPGQKVELPVQVLNDFEIEIPRGILVIVNNVNNTNINSAIRLASSPGYVFNHSKITIFGQPNSIASLSISLSNRDIDQEVTLSVLMLHCPPGYVLCNITKSCICSANMQNEQYVGINQCEDHTFRAVLQRGYWIGSCDKNATRKTQTLYTAMCPRRYCTRFSEHSENLILLPNSTSEAELDRFICGKYRTGLLCAECRENSSAFFHSENLDCTPDKNCEIGGLVFILSELLPVTILFIAITVFNIKITSGSIQGFILYAQIFDTLLITANGEILLEKKTYYALLYLRFFFRMFNLEFFQLSIFSFCLWKGASSLDILALKYVTILYALLLVIAMMLFLQKSKSANKIMVSLSRGRANSCIIHGLSTFLIMCYSQCTKISFLILTPTTVYSKGPQRYKQVAFYDGRLEFLKGKHLVYATPALLSIVTITILPPLLLTVYPLCYRVFSMMHIQESAFTKLACKIIPLEKFKPFFDSFQSSFKDEYRYFAGLYFLYRLMALLSFALVQTLPYFYLSILIQLMVMLLIHVLVQPYKKQWHNRLEIGIFFVLLFVTTLTFYSHTAIHLPKMMQKYASIDLSYVNGIKVTVAYLPAVYIVIRFIWKLTATLKKWIEKKCSTSSSLEECDMDLISENRELFSRYEKRE